MAGDWIKVRVRLVDDPAVLGISTRFGILPETVVGYLIRAWSWATDQLADGHAPGVTLAHFDRVVGLQNFGESLVEVGWLKATKTGLVFPKWDRHLSQGSKARALATNRKDRERHGAGVTKTRPEKRREDSKSPLPPQAGAASAASRKPAEPMTDQFRAFCDAYPSNRREGLQRAFKTWLADGLDDPKRFEFVMKALEVYKQSPRWSKDGGKYVEKMTSWLRNRKYCENPPTEFNEESKQ